MIFVTGANGLLGSYLVKLLLQQGQAVRALRRAESNLSLLGNYTKQIDWVEGDILDVPLLEQAMQGVEKVYHCAGVISFIPRQAEYMMKVNVEGTANVMNAALYAGVKKVVHVSSEAAFGLPTNGKIIDETYADPNIRKSPWYYRSKHYGEREAWRAQAEGLNMVVACPATIIGAGWWGHQPNTMFKEVYNGLRFYTRATNGFVDVRDCAECLYRLMESDITGEKFLIVSENQSFDKVVAMIADALQVKRPAWPVGKTLMALAWRYEVLKALLTRQTPMLTAESAALAETDFTYSNKKITEALGYTFRPLQQTIADTAQVFLTQRGAHSAYGVFY